MEIFNSLQPQVQGALIGAAATVAIGLVLFLLNWLRSACMAAVAHRRVVELELAKHDRADWVEFREAVTELVEVGEKWVLKAGVFFGVQEKRESGHGVHDLDEINALGVEVSDLGATIDRLLLKADVIAPQNGNFLLVHNAIVARNIFQKSNTKGEVRRNGYGPIVNNVRSLRNSILKLRGIAPGLPVPNGDALDIDALRDGRMGVPLSQLGIKAKRDEVDEAGAGVDCEAAEPSAGGLVEEAEDVKLAATRRTDRPTHGVIPKDSRSRN